MGFSRDEGKHPKPTLARVFHGRCNRCGQDIIAGQKYIKEVIQDVDCSSRVISCYKVHWECYVKL